MVILYLSKGESAYLLSLSRSVSLCLDIVGKYSRVDLM